MNKMEVKIGRNKVQQKHKNMKNKNTAISPSQE